MYFKFISFIFVVIIFSILLQVISSWKNVMQSRSIMMSLSKTPISIQSSSMKQVATITKSVLIASSTFLPLLSIADDGVTTNKKSKKVKVLETDLGIKYIELKKGTGAYPNVGDYVVISYIGFLSNGTIFDSTDAPGRKPITFRFGKKQQIDGLESVIANMQPGGECTCTIPPEYAFGKDGICLPDQGCLVPPNETVKYFIKLKSVGVSYG